MHKKMNYYYNQNNSDYPFEPTPKRVPPNLKMYQSQNNNYLNKKPQNFDYPLDLNSSPEESNIDIHPNKTQSEIHNSSRVRFVGTEADQDKKDKNDKVNYKKTDKDDNKITNNICIIINKPELKDRKNNKNVNIDYLNTFGNEEDGKSKKNHASFNNNKYLNGKVNGHKKSNSHFSNSKRKESYPIDSQDEYDNNSYMDTEPNNANKKATLHKTLNQKKRILKDLEQKIQSKKNVLKNKKSLLNQNKLSRSVILDSKDNLHKKNKNIKDSDYYSVKTKRKKPSNKININQNKNKKNMNDNISFSSEDRVFHDIPMIKIQKHKYYDDEKSINKTMYPDENHNRINMSFNKSIERKRKLLGIPLNKNGFQKMKNFNTSYKTEDISNINYVSTYKKRQDEMFKNYEKKNMINQRSREMIKNNYSNKPKNPIRITYNDYYNNAMNLKNRFDNDNNSYINKNYNQKISSNKNHNNKKLNLSSNSYIIKRPGYKNQKKRFSKSQEEIDNLTNKNKTQSYIIDKNGNKSYIKKKIKVYKFKVIDEQNRKNNLITNDNYRNTQEIMQFNPLSYKDEDLNRKKIYQNNSYYSKILSKIFNFSDDNYNKSTKNSTDKKNINYSRQYETNRNSYKNDSRKINSKKNIYINNYSYISPYKSRLIIVSPRNDPIMTIKKEDNEKIVHIVQKRNKSPFIIIPELRYSNQQYIGKRIVVQRPGKEKRKRMEKEREKEKEKGVEKEKQKIKKKIGKKEYKNNVPGPSRGISALRRINQRIENYKKRIPIRKRRRTKNRNHQVKSLSQLKKIRKHSFGRVKPSKSIKTLPDMNKNALHDFDFIDDI